MMMNDAKKKITNNSNIEDFPGRYRKEKGHRPPSHRAGATQALAAPLLCEEALAAL
jgi:hypothetical protein